MIKTRTNENIPLDKYKETTVGELVNSSKEKLENAKVVNHSYINKDGWYKISVERLGTIPTLFK